MATLSLGKDVFPENCKGKILILSISEVQFYKLFFKDAGLSQRVTGAMLLKFYVGLGMCRLCKRIHLSVDPNKYLTKHLGFIYNFKFLFLEDDFGPGVKQEESYWVFAMIFIVGIKMLFRLKSLRFSLTQSSLPHPLRPPHVAFKGYKVYQVYLNVLH